MDKTPYEAWFEQKPAVDHLRVLGCDAYVHVPKDERRNLIRNVCSWDTTKGYRLYDPGKDRVIYSRDVRFNEGGKPGSSTDNNSTTRRSDDADKLIIDFDSDADTDQNVEESPQPARRSTRERRQPEQGCIQKMDLGGGHTSNFQDLGGAVSNAILYNNILLFNSRGLRPPPLNAALRSTAEEKVQI